jgi:hypothetical protein
MRKIGMILLIAGCIVIMSYMVADLVVKEANGSNNPSVVHEIGRTIWSWFHTIGGAMRDFFSAFFLKADIPVAVKGAGAAVMLAVLLLIYSQMWGKSSRSSGGRSGHSKSRYHNMHY